jgi:hypothetical protein
MALGEVPEVPLYESNHEPGSTADVDFWTSRDVREVIKSHVNYVVTDTRQWEQSAAYFIDRHDSKPVRASPAPFISGAKLIILDTRSEC